MEQIIFLVAIMAGAGAIAGFMAGLLGIGGGIVMVPALYFAFGVVGVAEAWHMHMSVGTSLAIIITTAISSAHSHNKRGAVDTRIIKRWAPWIMVSAFLGAGFAGELSSGTLSLIFACFAFVMGAKLLLPVKDKPLTEKEPGMTVSAVVALLIGGVSSLMGIGGATLSVPAMTYFNVPIHRAVGTAALIGLLIALPATIGYLIEGIGLDGRPPYSIGFVNLAAVAVIAPIAAVAAPFGARAAHAIQRRTLSIIFGVFLIGMAIRMALEL